MTGLHTACRRCGHAWQEHHELNHPGIDKLLPALTTTSIWFCGATTNGVRCGCLEKARPE